MLVICSRKQLSKVHILDVAVGNAVITPSTKVRDLGVVLDTEMTMVDCINSVRGSVYDQIRNIGLICRFLCQGTSHQVVHACHLARTLTSATPCLLSRHGPQPANSNSAKTWQHGLSPAHASRNTSHQCCWNSTG